MVTTVKVKKSPNDPSPIEIEQQSVLGLPINRRVASPYLALIIPVATELTPREKAYLLWVALLSQVGAPCSAAPANKQRVYVVVIKSSRFFLVSYEEALGSTTSLIASTTFVSGLSRRPMLAPVRRQKTKSICWVPLLVWKLVY